MRRCIGHRLSFLGSLHVLETWGKPGGNLQTCGRYTGFGGGLCLGTFLPWPAALQGPGITIRAMRGMKSSYGLKRPRQGKTRVAAPMPRPLHVRCGAYNREWRGPRVWLWHRVPRLRRSATVPPFDAEHGCKQRSRGTRQLPSTNDQSNVKRRMPNPVTVPSLAL